MQHLRNNLLLILTFLAAGCQSAPVFEVQTLPASPKTKLGDRHIIRIQSNRVRQECLFLNAEAENKWRHQHFMYLLTDKNEVLPIMYSINQEGGVCREQLNRIQKILDRETKVVICANSELTKTIKEDERFDSPVHFRGLGTYKIVYDALFLDAVCNSKGCFVYKDFPGCSGMTQKSDEK
ncbi:MAG: hypothetical protein NDI61_13140 [Bdellovibrionaceae bacterium]|nr:hypothetical protein [Pseudobdellovibrionaceae bacterium]